MKRRVAILLLVAMLLSLVSIIGLTEGGDRFVSGDYAYLILPDGTAEITAFSKSYSGGTLTIPSELAGHRVTSIGAQAFFGRENLTEIVIPEGVTNIGDYALRMPPVNSYCLAGQLGDYWRKPVCGLWGLDGYRHILGSSRPHHARRRIVQQAG